MLPPPSSLSSLPARLPAARRHPPPGLRWGCPRCGPAPAPATHVPARSGEQGGAGPSRAGPGRARQGSALTLLALVVPPRPPGAVSVVSGGSAPAAIPAGAGPRRPRRAVSLNFSRIFSHPPNLRRGAQGRRRREGAPALWLPGALPSPEARQAAGRPAAAQQKAIYTRGSAPLRHPPQHTHTPPPRLAQTRGRAQHPPPPPGPPPAASTPAPLRSAPPGTETCRGFPAPWPAAALHSLALRPARCGVTHRAGAWPSEIGVPRSLPRCPPPKGRGGGGDTLRSWCRRPGGGGEAGCGSRTQHTRTQHTRTELLARTGAGLRGEEGDP